MSKVNERILNAFNKGERLTISKGQTIVDDGNIWVHGKHIAEKCKLTGAVFITAPDDVKSFAKVNLICNRLQMFTNKHLHTIQFNVFALDPVTHNHADITGVWMVA